MQPLVISIDGMPHISQTVIPPPPTFYITFLCFPVSACAVGGKNVGGRLQVMTLGLLIESEEFRSVLVPTEVLGA